MVGYYWETTKRFVALDIVAEHGCNIYIAKFDLVLGRMESVVEDHTEPFLDIWEEIHQGVVP